MLKKISSLGSVLLLIGILFSGCTILKQTEVKIYNSTIIDDEGFPSLTLSIRTTGTITLKLIAPSKAILFEEEYYEGIHDIIVPLDDYRRAPTPGTYTLKAYDKGNTNVFEEDFIFEGARVSIEEVEEVWWQDEGMYNLVGLHLTLSNSGDLPAYPFRAAIIFENTDYSSLVLPQSVLPNNQEEVSTCLLIKDISAGYKSMDITLDNVEEEILATISYDALPTGTINDLTFSWNYEEKKNLVLPDISFLYSYYKGLDRLLLEDYALYIFDAYDDLFVNFMVDRLSSLTTETGDVALINFIVSFVQNIRYEEDSQGSAGCEEYPRYPLELLKDAEGDCEDKAILTAAILDTLGYNVTLLRLPSHMAVGVHLSEDATSYAYFIEEYYYLETTRSPWVVGRVPDEYIGLDNITLHTIADRPLLFHSWKNATRLNSTDGTDYVKMQLLIENYGRVPASSFEMRMAFYSENNIRFNQVTTTIPTLASGSKKVVELTADVPKNVDTTLKTQIFLDGELVHEKVSTDTFP